MSEKVLICWLVSLTILSLGGVILGGLAMKTHELWYEYFKAFYKEKFGGEP